MTFLYITIGIITLFIIFEIISAVYFFNYAILPKPFILEEAIVKYPNHDFSSIKARVDKARKELPFYKHEELTCKSLDGLSLYGAYYHSDKPRGICLVMCHGYNNNGICELGYTSLFYLSHGCDVLLIDMRACGKSEGKYITFGVRESEDVAQWCELIDKTYHPEHIILQGISLGGATVMMATGEKLPASVHGVIEDCGFTSPYDQFSHVLKIQFKMPKILILPVTNLLCKAVTGFGFKDKNNIEIMKKNKLPTLFVHGEEDNYVPFYMAKQIYDVAGGDNEYFPVPKARHAESFYTEQEACEKAAGRLIKKATGIDIYE